MSSSLPIRTWPPASASWSGSNIGYLSSAIFSPRASRVRWWWYQADRAWRRRRQASHPVAAADGPNVPETSVNSVI